MQTKRCICQLICNDHFNFSINLWENVVPLSDISPLLLQCLPDEYTLSLGPSGSPVNFMSSVVVRIPVSARTVLSVYLAFHSSL